MSGKLFRIATFTPTIKCKFIHRWHFGLVLTREDMLFGVGNLLTTSSAFQVHPHTHLHRRPPNNVLRDTTSSSKYDLRISLHLFRHFSGAKAAHLVAILEFTSSHRLDIQLLHFLHLVAFDVSILTLFHSTVIREMGWLFAFKSVRDSG